MMFLFYRFYATGGFYIIVGDGHGPATATVCRVVHRVTHALVREFSHVICWPTDRESVDAIKAKFYAIAGIPDVVGEFFWTFLLWRLYSVILFVYHGPVL